MTVGETLEGTTRTLWDCGIETAGFEAKLLISAALEINTARLPIIKKDVISKVALLRLTQFLEERLSGCPLQYILGEWEFYGLPIIVREGVLIPRPDTELLVDNALEFIKKTNAKSVIDLCCGSGCVAIAVAKNAPETEITAIDYYDTPLQLTHVNIEHNDCTNIKILKRDVFSGASQLNADLILSNPPYIPSADISGLSLEVAREPVTALDGGADGLDFYRAIADKWVQALNKGGFLMVEVGINQAGEVAKLFEKAELENIDILKDINGISRVVIGNNNK